MRLSKIRESFREKKARMLMVACNEEMRDLSKEEIYRVYGERCGVAFYMRMIKKGLIKEHEIINTYLYGDL